MAAKPKPDPAVKATLNNWLVRMTTPHVDHPVKPPPMDEAWRDMMTRLNETKIVAVPQRAYEHFLNVLPPRWVGGSGFFAFGEGDDPLTLFWVDGGLHFARQFTDAENREFCKLAGVSLVSG